MLHVHKRNLLQKKLFCLRKIIYFTIKTSNIIVQLKQINQYLYKSIFSFTPYSKIIDYFVFASKNIGFHNTGTQSKLVP